MSLEKVFVKSKKAYKVTFSLPKEAVKGAKTVKLLGDFNNWEKDKGVAMKIKDGNFIAAMDLKPGKEIQFRYLVDNKIWVNDWQADKYVPTPYGVENSVVVTVG